MYGRLKDQEMRANAMYMAKSVNVAQCGDGDAMARYMQQLSDVEEKSEAPTIEDQFQEW
jgi:hypothetical protein